MFNVHPCFSLKKLGKKCTLHKAKYSNPFNPHKTTLREVLVISSPFQSRDRRRKDVRGGAPPAIQMKGGAAIQASVPTILCPVLLLLSAESLQAAQPVVRPEKLSGSTDI